MWTNTAASVIFDFDMVQRVVNALIEKFVSAQIAFGGKLVNKTQLFHGKANGDGIAAVRLRHKRVDWCRPLSLNNSVSDNVIL